MLSAAERFAKTMALPVKACAVTQELYGYTKPMLDTRKARDELSLAGFNTEQDALAAGRFAATDWCMANGVVFDDEDEA